MKKAVTKRVITLMLAVLFLFSQIYTGVPIKGAASEAIDVMIAGYNNISKSSIYQGDEFSMSLTVKNLTASAISNVYIVLDSGSSFSIKNPGSNKDIGSSSIKVDDIPGNGEQKTVNTSFIYNGGSNRLKVTIKYNNGVSNYEQSDYITITEAKPTDTSSSSSSGPDTSKYTPKIAISSNAKLPSGAAGSNITYTLPLKNTGTYAAKNITISPVFDDATPIEMQSMSISKTVDAIQPNETKDVTFDFTISSNAKVKNYPIKFNIQYYNTWDNYYSSTETAYLKVTSSEKLPRLALKSISTNPSPVHAGDDFVLNLKLQNEGNISAKDINVALTGLKNDGTTIVGGSGRQVISNIYGGSSTDLSFNLAASPKIEAGPNSLKLKLDYRDASGNSYSDELEFFYNIQDSGSSANIELKNIVSPNSSLIPGDNALIAFDVANTGSIDAQNVKVSISSDKEIIPRTLNTIVIPTLKKGEKKNVQFQLFVSDDAITKNYPVAINIEYDINSAGTKTKQTVMQYVGFYVENASGKSVPRLIIEKYSLDPSAVSAGQKFNLKMSILNTSRTSTINNVKITVLSEDGTFSTVNSNSFYVESISPKASVEKQLILCAKSDAAPKQYTLTINYEYEDAKGTAFTSKDSVGIPITQMPRLQIGEINIPPQAFIGSPVPINISFYNMGKSTLYNFMVKLEGNFKSENGSYYVGNFDAGKSDTFDGAIIPQDPGQAKGDIIFSFEDADGKTQEIKKEISINVTQMPMPKEGMMDAKLATDKKESKIPIWAFIVGGVVLLGIAAAVVIIIRKKRKARKDLMLDEEL